MKELERKQIVIQRQYDCVIEKIQDHVKNITSLRDLSILAENKMNTQKSIGLSYITVVTNWKIKFEKIIMTTVKAQSTPVCLLILVVFPRDMDGLFADF